MRGKKKQQNCFTKSPYPSSECIFGVQSGHEILVSENLFLQVMDVMNAVLKCIGFCLFERLSMLPLQKCSN